MSMVDHPATTNPLGLQEKGHRDWLPVRDLKLPRYQRVYSDLFGRQIAREFDPDKFAPLLVSRRMDGYYVIDGQHRLRAVRDVLGWADQNVPCDVFEGLTETQEIAMFMAQTGRDRRQLGAADRIRAAYLAGSPGAVAMVEAVERAGVSVSWHSHHARRGMLVAVAAAERIERDYGADVLERVVRRLGEAFDQAGEGYSTGNLAGMAAFMVRYEQDVDWPNLIAKLRKMGHHGLYQKAMNMAGLLGASAASAATVGRTLHAIYNASKTAHRLPEWVDNLRSVQESGRAVEAKRRGQLLRNARERRLKSVQNLDNGGTMA